MKNIKHDYKLIQKIFMKHCVYRGGSDYIDVTMAMQDYAERYAERYAKNQLKRGPQATPQKSKT